MGSKPKPWGRFIRSKKKVFGLSVQKIFCLHLWILKLSVLLSLTLYELQIVQVLMIQVNKIMLWSYNWTAPLINNYVQFIVYVNTSLIVIATFTHMHGRKIITKDLVLLAGQNGRFCPPLVLLAGQSVLSSACLSPNPIKEDKHPPTRGDKFYSKKETLH